MIISRKRFEAEVQKRVNEAASKIHETYWREDQERENHRRMNDLEIRLIVCEKELGIVNPSHNNLEQAKVPY